MTTTIAHSPSSRTTAAAPDLNSPVQQSQLPCSTVEQAYGSDAFSTISANSDTTTFGTCSVTSEQEHEARFNFADRKPVPNFHALALDFTHREKIAFCSRAGSFYQYDPSTGKWCPVSNPECREIAALYIKKTAKELEKPELLTMRTTGFLDQILKFAQGCAPLGAPPVEPLLLVKNGVLDPSGEEPVLRDFSSDYWFTSGIPVPYIPDAKCPRFLDDLLKPALPDPDDVHLLQRDFGRQLFDGNAAQTIAVIFGEGGSGKSVLLSTFEHLVGRDRVAHLRADHLGGRFETSFFQSKAILVGKDVRPDFLNNRGAAMLKSLTGNDVIQTERKYGGKQSLRGSFYVIITANSRPTIDLEDDEEAWQRRMVVYEFSREAPVNRVPNFHEDLLRTEGPGIFAWLVEGYRAHQKELREHGRLQLTEAQQLRVKDMVQESDAEKVFVRETIVAGQGTLTSEEIWASYRKFTRSRGWKPLSMTKFLTRLTELMEELFGVQKSTHIYRNGAAKRGFNGVSFRAPQA